MCYMKKSKKNQQTIYWSSSDLGTMTKHIIFGFLVLK